MSSRDESTLVNARLGAPGHAGVPLIFAWGLHIGLSYQRPGFQQATLEYMVHNGIEEPTKWGANLVEFYPSNKEKHFKDAEFAEHAEPPVHLFREHPDNDQEVQWGVEHFQAFNRAAHERGCLVSWFIHQWYRSPRVRRAHIMWKLIQELGLHVADPLRQGWQECLDGLAVEGSFFVPEAVCEYLWPHHPGAYYREAMWNYNYTTPNFVQSAGYHLTDGRDLICDSDYSIKPRDSLVGHPAVWRGEDHRVQYGRQWVSAQIEARDLRCGEEGWEEYGGMATVDLLVEQINNYGRAKGVNWTGACTTAMRFINEVLISPRMRRYVFGIAQDPVRCAIAGEITATAANGRFPRVDQPAGIHFLQNNHFRLYCRPDDGRVLLRWDASGLADHTEFLSTSVQGLFDDLLQTRALPGQQYWGCEYQVLEEAGALATLRQRIEWRTSDGEAVSEFRSFTTESDSPWLRVQVDRLFARACRPSETVLNLGDYRLAQDTAPDDLRPGQMVRLVCPEKPDIDLSLPEHGADSIGWEEGMLLFRSPESASVSLRFSLFIGTGRVEPPEAKWLNRTPRVSLVTGEACILNPTHFTCARAVRVLDPPDGVYWVEEDGWWRCRPAQPSRQRMGTDYCKVILRPGSAARIRPYGLLEGVCKPGWGCQYAMLLKNVAAHQCGGSAEVQVVDLSPKLFAPRIEFAHPIAAVELDGRPWHYFDERFVFLPQERATHCVEVTHGTPRSPHLIATFACVRETSWSEGIFEFAAEWNEWCDGAPAGFQYHAAVELEGHGLPQVVNGEVVRRVPRFDSVDAHDLAGDDTVIHMVPRDFHETPLKPLHPHGGVVVRFLPNRVRLLIQDAPSMQGDVEPRSGRPVG